MRIWSPWRSLSGTVILLSLLAVGSPLIVGFLLIEKSNDALMDQTQEEDFQKIAALTSLSLSGPLWDLSPRQAESVLLSLESDPRFIRAIIYDQSKEVFAQTKLERAIPKEPRILTKEVKKGTETIGFVEITFAKTHRADAIAASRNRYLGIAFVQMLLGLLTLVALLHFRFVRPLYRLRSEAQSLADRDLSQSFLWTRHDEIGQVGRELERTRVALANAFDELHQINHNLESVVDERTHQVIQVQKLSAIGEMASSLAHEINNPLAVISASAQRIQEAARKNDFKQEKMADYADKIEKMIERIGKIIRGLKTLSRRSSNEVPILYPVKKLLEETLELCAERFKKLGIQLKIDPYPAGLEVPMRPSEIGQVLLNMINNSVDAIEDLPERWIRIRILTVSPFLRFEIIDSGSGLTAEIAAKMMEPFFTTKPIGKGTGLGLSISKSIIEQHHGRFYVEPSARNTTIVFEIPLDGKAHGPSSSLKAIGT